jgi:hypothetical protein
MAYSFSVVFLHKGIATGIIAPKLAAIIYVACQLALYVCVPQFVRSNNYAPGLFV